MTPGVIDQASEEFTNSGCVSQREPLGLSPADPKPYASHVRLPARLSGHPYALNPCDRIAGLKNDHSLGANTQGGIR